MKTNRVTGGRIVDDLRTAGVDPLVVQMVERGLAAIAERIRTYDRPLMNAWADVELPHIAALVDPKGGQA